MSDSCFICEKIEEIKKGANPFFVAELETGYVVVGFHQYFKGYSLFLCKQHKRELHELEPDFKMKFLEEMSLVAEAVYKAFKPNKLNYEMLGNSEEHLHWHLFPRHLDDPVPTKPVWTIAKEVREAPQYMPDEKQLEELKNKLTESLKTVLK